LRGLRRSYVEYMNSKLLELYISYQYKDPLRLFYEGDKLEKLLQRGVRLEWALSPEDVVAAMLQLYRFTRAAAELRRIIGEADRFLTQRRVYEIVEDWSIRGIIDWPRTIRNYPQGGPIVQRVVSYTINSPENLLLRAAVDYVLRELGRIAEAMRRGLLRPRIDVGSSVIAKMPGIRRALREVLKAKEALEEAAEGSILLSRIPRDIYDPDSPESLMSIVEEIEHTPWKPEWVRRLLDEVVYRYYLFNPEVEDELKTLTTIVVGKLLEEPDPATVRWILRVYEYKLYEVYCLYLTIKVLEDGGFDIDFGHKSVRGSRGGRTIEILFNRTLEDLKTPIMARPDITLRNTERIVVEAKFSANPSYLTQAVFKVISYMVLLNAEKGILAYPTISRRKPLDEEEREVYETVFQKPAEKEGTEEHIIEPEPITISVNGKQYELYVLQLEPSQEKERTNTVALKRVILQNDKHVSTPAQID